MKKLLIIFIFSFLVGCANLTNEERLVIETKIDHEECISLGFKEGTEAYGGCRLTLKSIRAQNKTTQAIKRNSMDNNRFCNRWYCW